jgi:hypothetical protein
MRRGLLLTLAVSLCAMALASPGMAIDFQAAPQSDPAFAPMTGPGDLPPGCSNHWKTPDVRVRNVARDTYIHEMSNNCVPYGPVDGTVPASSTFRLYFADPYDANWCYGYSVNLSKLGYVECDAVHP